MGVQCRLSPYEIFLLFVVFFPCFSAFLQIVVDFDKLGVQVLFVCMTSKLLAMSLACTVGNIQKCLNQYYCKVHTVQGLRALPVLNPYFTHTFLYFFIFEMYYGQISYPR